MDHEVHHNARIPSVVRSGMAILFLLTGLSCSSPSTREIHWEALPGPYALNVSAVYPVGTGSMLYAGLTNGETAISFDAGRSWSYRTPVARGYPVRDFARDPDSPTGIYATTARGLFRSADSARTWRAVPLAAPGQLPLPVLSFTFDPWKPERRFVGTEGRGIYRSTDAGSTWYPIPLQKDSSLAFASIWTIIVDPGRPDRILAAAGTFGLLTSTDGGSSLGGASGRVAVAA